MPLKMAMFHYGSLANGLELPYAYLTIFTASGYFCAFLPEDYIVTETCWFSCNFKSLYPIISPLTSQVIFVSGKIQGFFSNSPKKWMKKKKEKNLTRKERYNLFAVTGLLKENRYSVVLI